MESSILGPVVALAAWTMIIWIWMYATRIPAMNRAGIDGTKIVGSSSGSLRDALIVKGEEKASWVADNYNHLHEAPTVFYAICLTLALVGQGDNLNATIAWVNRAQYGRCCQWKRQHLAVLELFCPAESHRSPRDPAPTQPPQYYGE